MGLFGWGEKEEKKPEKKPKKAASKKKEAKEEDFSFEEDDDDDLFWFGDFITHKKPILGPKIVGNAHKCKDNDD